MQLITWAQYSHSWNKLPTLSSCPQTLLDTFQPRNEGNPNQKYMPQFINEWPNYTTVFLYPPSLWSVGTANPVDFMHRASFNGCFHSPVVLSSRPTKHPCSSECVFYFHPTHEKPSAGRSHGHSLCLLCQQRCWSVEQFKSCHCSEAIFAGWCYSWSAINIYSSHAFSKHPTQLHQQLHSWLCQGQAKQFQYCRVGHQNTLLNVSGMSGVTLWGVATNLHLKNGLLYVVVPHLYWDLFWCSPGVHMLALLCLQGKSAVPLCETESWQSHF